VAVELVTKEGIPLVRVGSYDLSSGPRVFTEEDLMAAADALANDPAIKPPRVKIDSVEKALGLDPVAHGGEPAFGWFDGLRVVDNGQTLVGDFHGPKAVADAMEWAYLNLSIEGPPPGWTSATGRSYGLVISAVALLGVHWPGVSTLDDFTEFLAEGPKIERTEAPEMVLATLGVTASLDQDLVARRLIDAIDTGGIELPEGVASYSLWLRSLRFDDNGEPYAKVTDEDSGRLYRVDFKVSGSEVTFGEFVEVVEQDVPVTAGMVRRAPVAVWASRDESRAVMASRGGDVGMTDEQRRALAAGYGLDPETATEADIMAAATAAAEARQAETPPEPTPEPEPDPVPVAASDRTVTVTREQWEQMQTRVSAAESTLTAQQRQRDAEHRDGLVRAALSDGRLSPVEAGLHRNADGTLPDGWRRDLDEAPEVTERLLARLTPNRIPVAARGVERQEGVNAGGDEQAHEQYMRGFGRPKAAREVNGVRMISGGV
jgi:hypothetical protein